MRSGSVNHNFWLFYITMLAKFQLFIMLKFHTVFFMDLLTLCSVKLWEHNTAGFRNGSKFINMLLILQTPVKSCFKSGCSFTFILGMKQHWPMQNKRSCYILYTGKSNKPVADRWKDARQSHHIDDINLTQMLRGCGEPRGRRWKRSQESWWNRS